MKLLILALFAVLVGLSAAAWHPTECGPLQRLKVKRQWAEAFDFSVHREELDEDVWHEIFEDHPDWPALYFERVRGDNTFSPEFRAHAARIISQFDIMVTMLDEPEALQAEIEHIAHKHSTMHIPEAAFDVFKRALIHAVQKRIGHCFNFDAWNLCTEVIIGGIKNVIHADEAAAE